MDIVTLEPDTSNENQVSRYYFLPRPTRHDRFAWSKESPLVLEGHDIPFSTELMLRIFA